MGAETVGEWNGLLDEAERRLFASPTGWERARESARAAWRTGKAKGRRSIPIQPDDDDVIVLAALERGERLDKQVAATGGDAEMIAMFERGRRRRLFLVVATERGLLTWQEVADATGLTVDQATMLAAHYAKIGAKLAKQTRQTTT